MGFYKERKLWNEKQRLGKRIAMPIKRDWHFTTWDARIRLKLLYRSFQDGQSTACWASDPASHFAS